MSQKKNVNRRCFLKRTAAAVAGVAGFPYIVPSSVLGKAGNSAPSNRVTIGCIGVGSQGSGVVMRNFLAQKDAQVVAVCDVKTHMREKARQSVEEHYQSHSCTAYNDFRKLLARNDIDAVTVATPDHWHVPVALAAAKAGKDVYLEKPMGLSVAENQALRDVAHNYGTVFQFGTQQRSDSKFRIACELVRNGRIGKLHTINVWSPGSAPGGSTEIVPVPEWLDYDMWLGPAPYVPYSKDRCSNKQWWFNSDYALGFIAGWGIHPVDVAVWGAGPELAGKAEIEGSGIIPKEGFCDTAVDWDVACKFESGVTINFTGEPPPDKWKERYKYDNGHGTAFEGTEGWVYVDRTVIDACPKKILDSHIGPNEIHLYRSNNHVGNLLDCVKTRSKTICCIDEAVRSDIFCHISEIAIRTGRKLIWDSVKECSVNDDVANRMLKRAMRSPWRL